MANLARMRDHLSDLYDHVDVPANSPLFEAWFAVHDAIVDGVRPSADWREEVEKAKQKGHVRWRM